MAKIDVSHLSGHERLALLSEILKTKVNPARFNMYKWANRTRISPESMSCEEDKHSCGTAACALGTAAVFFKDLVLWETTWGVVHVRYKGFEDYEAAERFFDLTEEEAESLFDPYEYHTNGIYPIKPVDAARRIDKLLESRAKK